MDAKAEDSVLIQSCLSQRPFAWQKFVDRYLPAVLQAIQEIDTQSSRGWSEAEHNEYARLVFQRVKEAECKLLGEWDSATDFETWLVVVVRRIVLAKTGATPEAKSDAGSGAEPTS